MFLRGESHEKDHRLISRGSQELCPVRAETAVGDAHGKPFWRILDYWADALRLLDVVNCGYEGSADIMRVWANQQLAE